jgi:hypothetical protein
MPVPEPSTAGGLWESVKPITGWPQTDEDLLAQLAGDWRSGARRFATAGGFDLTGLGGLWPDPAGEATGERARGTLINVMGTADGMAMLAARVDAFAGAVRGCKIDIGRIVEANIPGYTTARRLPPGLAESDATIIRSSVIAQVNERIGGCVREIGGLGLQPTDLPVGGGARGGTLEDILTNPNTVIDPGPDNTRTDVPPVALGPGRVPIAVPGLGPDGLPLGLGPNGGPGGGPYGGPGGGPYGGLNGGPYGGPYGGLNGGPNGGPNGEPPAVIIDAERAGDYEWAEPDARTDVLDPGEGWEPSDGVPVLGRQPDTKVGRDWPDHDTLNIPGWSTEKNDAYIQTIINQQGAVYAGSPTQGNYWNVEQQQPTVYAREVQQLLQAGYRWSGNYLLPPE